MRKLEQAPPIWVKAKYVSRVSERSLPGVSNSNVEKNRQKMTNGKKLSPLVLVRNPAAGQVVVAPATIGCVRTAGSTKTRPSPAKSFTKDRILSINAGQT